MNNAFSLRLFIHSKLHVYLYEVVVIIYGKRCNNSRVKILHEYKTNVTRCLLLCHASQDSYSVATKPYFLPCNVFFLNYHAFTISSYFYECHNDPYWKYILYFLFIQPTNLRHSNEYSVLVVLLQRITK